MESSKELNGPLRDEVNKRFEDLFKKIGNNRQQLANKVIGSRTEINKELTKTKVDAKRGEEILREVTAVEKMAAKQLPHLERVPERSSAPAPTPAPVAVKVAAPVKAPAPASAPAAAKGPAPVKATSKATPPSKAKAKAPAATKKTAAKKKK